MKVKNPSKRDHELKDLEDFGKVRLDPDNLVDPAKEEALEAERFYQRKNDSEEQR